MDKILVAAETNEAVLAVLGTELKDFDLDKLTGYDELSERFQCLAGQLNFIEVVLYDEYKVKATWVVTNREFRNGQVVDLGIEWEEVSSRAVHAYDNESDAQRCALATVACYLGQPDMIHNLVNE